MHENGFCLINIFADVCGNLLYTNNVMPNYFVYKFINKIKVMKYFIFLLTRLFSANKIDSDASELWCFVLTSRRLAQQKWRKGDALRFRDGRRYRFCIYLLLPGVRLLTF